MTFFFPKLQRARGSRRYGIEILESIPSLHYLHLTPHDFCRTLFLDIFNFLPTSHNFSHYRQFPPIPTHFRPFPPSPPPPHPPCSLPLLISSPNDTNIHLPPHASRLTPPCGNSRCESGWGPQGAPHPAATRSASPSPPPPTPESGCGGPRLDPFIKTEGLSDQRGYWM